MPLRRTVIRGADLAAQLTALRTELSVPAEFPLAALTEAEQQAKSGGVTDGAADATDIPLVTLDPPGSRDLDQAFFVEQAGAGFRVTYAIADVGAFVSPGGA